MQLDLGKWEMGKSRSYHALMEWIFKDVSKIVNLYKLYLSV